jgi:hypothetical protein
MRKIKTIIATAILLAIVSILVESLPIAYLSIAMFCFSTSGLLSLNRKDFFAQKTLHDQEIKELHEFYKREIFKAQKHTG